MPELQLPPTYSIMLTALESGIQSFVQSWIADPLQFSGVCLETQIRLVTAAVCAAVISWNFEAILLSNWLWLSVMAIWACTLLHESVFGLSADIKMWITSHRWNWIYWVSLSIIYMFLQFAMRSFTLFDFALYVVTLGFALRWFLLKCQPKPPVGNPRTVSDLP